MVQICPLCSKETSDQNDEEIDVDCCDKCMTAAIDMEDEKQCKQMIIGEWIGVVLMVRLVLLLRSLIKETEQNNPFVTINE
ncbi:hypothetical protein PVK73_15890 [Bacillus thuringiensis]